MSHPKGLLGGSTQKFETPERKKRRRKARKNQEKYWASKAGPVTIRYKETPED